MGKWVSCKSSISDFIEWYSWNSFRLLTGEFSPCVLYEIMRKVKFVGVMLDMDQSVGYLRTYCTLPNTDRSDRSNEYWRWVLLFGQGLMRLSEQRFESVGMGERPCSAPSQASSCALGSDIGVRRRPSSVLPIRDSVDAGEGVILWAAITVSSCGKQATVPRASWSAMESSSSVPMPCVLMAAILEWLWG